VGSELVQSFACDFESNNKYASVMETNNAKAEVAQISAVSCMSNKPWATGSGAVQRSNERSVASAS
jgi:hypothetical protein